MLKVGNVSFVPKLLSLIVCFYNRHSMKSFPLYIYIEREIINKAYNSQMSPANRCYNPWRKQVVIYYFSTMLTYVHVWYTSVLAGRNGYNTSGLFNLIRKYQPLVFQK